MLFGLDVDCVLYRIGRYNYAIIAVCVSAEEADMLDRVSGEGQ